MSIKREITTRIMMAFGLSFAIFSGALEAAEPGLTVHMLLFILGTSAFFVGMDLRYKEDQ
jgi:hypothetical protein